MSNTVSDGTIQRATEKTPADCPATNRDGSVA